MNNHKTSSETFITCNSEYQVRDGRVVAVRRRGESSWLSSHRALGMRLIPHDSPIEAGDRLWLGSGNDVLTTSTVVTVIRSASWPSAA